MLYIWVSPLVLLHQPEPEFREAGVHTEEILHDFQQLLVFD